MSRLNTFIMRILIVALCFPAYFWHWRLTDANEMLPSTYSVLTKSNEFFSIEYILSRLNESRDPSGIIFFSPLGIYMSYSMVLKGATGDTKNEILDKLKLKNSFPDPDEIHIEFQKLIDGYRKAEKSFLLIGNMAVVSKKVSLKREYVKAVAKYYNATILERNFVQQEDVLKAVNEHVAKMTDSKIVQLLKEPPSQNTLMILLNVIYFKGKWKLLFDEKETRNHSFNNADGTKSTVKMMNLYGAKLPVANFKDIKVIELPFEGNISMVIFMSNKMNSLHEWIHQLTPETWALYSRDMRAEEISHVAVPKFKLSDTHDLHESLPLMGLKLPFSESAEFWNISERPVRISQSIHQAVIEVNEEGATAAGATATQVEFRSLPVVEERNFILDRPFLFMLRDRTVALNIFVGLVNRLPNA